MMRNRLLALFITAAAALTGELASAQTPAQTPLPEGVDSITTVTTVTTVQTTYHTQRRTPTPAATQPQTVAPATTPTPAVAVPVATEGVALPATAPTAAQPEAVPVIVHDTVYVDRPVYIETPSAADPATDAGEGILPDLPGAPHHYTRNADGKIVLASIAPSLLNSKVVIGTDTVPFIIPTRNFGRYDRGLYNFMFVPQGQWMFALTASYGEFNTADLEMLSVLKDFSFKGKMYSLQPMVSYFFRHNQSIGLRFKYSHAGADLAGLSMDFDDDLNFSISDVSYYSHTYTSSIVYRNYVGLGTEKRFGIFNEVDLSFGSGQDVFRRLYNSEPRETRTYNTKFGLNFSPGFTMFIMDNVCFNVSIGVFGLHLTHARQVTDGVEEGRRTSSGANFRLNLFNINFGIGVCI